MTTSLNARLIDAVEAGNEAGVKQLIEAGASPNARKMVTLRATVDNGAGGFAWKEDTVECESALALAVLHAHVETVRVLLENGGSVNGEVGWSISDYGGIRNRTTDEWQRKRWVRRISFPSPLTVAIGRGGKERICDGDDSTIPYPNGQLPISVRGGAVTLNHPKERDHVRVMLTLQPNDEIVRLLLAYGAHVTYVELDAVRKNPNKDFIRTLESHQRSPIPRAERSVPSPLELANATLTAQIQVLKARVAAAEVKARVAERKLAESETNTAALQTRNSALDQENSDLRSRNLTLDQEVSTLRTRTSTLDQDNASLRVDLPHLRQETISLRQENSSLRHEIASLYFHNATLLTENTTLRSQVPAAPQSPHPPTRVRRMMFAVADYEPNDADEIGFVVGDGIFVNLQYADGWGQGFHTSTNIIGHFPLSYVSPDFTPPGSIPLAPTAPPPTASRLDSLPQFTAQQAPTTPPSSRGVRDVVGPPAPRAALGRVGGGVGSGAAGPGQVQVQARQGQGGGWWANAGGQTGMIAGGAVPERGLETVGLQAPASGRGAGSGAR